jgi:hypothetical protein
MGHLTTRFSHVVTVYIAPKELHTVQVGCREGSSMTRIRTRRVWEMRTSTLKREDQVWGYKDINWLYGINF